MIPLLHRLEPHECELIINSSQQVDVKKGDNVYSEGDPANKLYFIKKGKIKNIKRIGKGKELILFTRKEQDCFGEIGLFSGLTYTNTAVAMEKSSLYVLEKEWVEKLVTDNGRMGLKFTRWVAESLEASNAKIRDYIAFGSEGAIAAVFIRYSNMYGIVTKEGIRITEPIMLRDVSKHIGISRETVSRVVNMWKSQGVLSSENKYFLINDLSYFQRLLSCETCSIENCTL
ncbi:cyclic nucleotide-binding domain-containing protein [Ornithinibacillus sp. L9]|uniref:Cyclic nucleotide-binding domain-containing protein n=1 Tax=Ornithinibacillus caprae TaxID=2678566 RepID=A0A6N8FGW4_9BACI|nr:Crp/Fnr family transcriptional regulator [Ornithinibacillus caprae]MUK88810.1 cyclic nucleotide-binding domain-containing protein [Ornithinibacillus caprae]